MKCMVRWENRGQWRGPFEVVGYVHPECTHVRIDVGKERPDVPKNWTLGIDDGWTIWAPVENGEEPCGTHIQVDAMRRDGEPVTGFFEGNLRWSNHGTDGDIIAYRIAEPKTKEELPLSVILSEWWLDDIGNYRQVIGVTSGSYATGNKWVSRDWFTGRRHLTAEELAEEMEG